MRAFKDQEYIEHSAVIMVDADGLKTVNDNFGHERGDRYLHDIAGLLNEFGRSTSGEFLAARNGGDEFVMFIYGYDSDEVLISNVEKIYEFRDTRDTVLPTGDRVALCFSVGYSIHSIDSKFYGDMLKVADANMYEEKRKRKSEAAR